MEIKLNEPWITGPVRCQNVYAYIDHPFWNAENSRPITNGSISESTMGQHSSPTRLSIALRPSMKEANYSQRQVQYLLIYA